jgi:hypothetical protein
MAEFHSPLIELTLARLREFIRDPGAVFWTFGFPIVLAVALGIAFRESPPPQAHVAVARSGADADQVAAALEADDGITAQVLDDDAASRALATGKIDLLVIPAARDDGWVYRFDAMRPEARTARLAVDAAVQRRGWSRATTCDPSPARATSTSWSRA